MRTGMRPGDCLRSYILVYNNYIPTAIVSAKTVYWECLYYTPQLALEITYREAGSYHRGEGVRLWSRVKRQGVAS